MVTLLPGQDPELEDAEPSSVATYFLEVSGAPWWVGKLRTHLRLATGKTQRYGFLTEQTAPGVVRSVRLQLFTYVVAIAISVALGYPYFFVYWLIPLAAAQPLLRAILLAEHMGCSETSDMLRNTRTTYTVWAEVRRLPMNLLDAIRALQANDALKKALGASFIDAYAKIKDREWHEHNAQISPWERQTTLDC